MTEPNTVADPNEAVREWFVRLSRNCAAVDFDSEMVDFADCARYCLKMVSSQADARGLRLDCKLPSKMAIIWADERKLKQILINLLSNAVKFTPEGGKITLNAGLGSTGDLMLQIIDSGIGIAREDVWKAMAPFYQIDSPQGRDQAGTGLGLPLSKALAELHGGTLELTSRPGHGTTVSVILPAERLRQAAA